MPPEPAAAPSDTPWRSLAAALIFGAATAFVLLSALSVLSPASRAAPAALQAAQAILNGQSAIMREAFAHEIRLEAASGVYDWGGPVRMSMLYAERGQALSFARVANDPSQACSLALEIDGDGQPALAQSAFAAFSGAIQGAPPGLAPPRAAGAAFTVAHELAHCELGSLPWARASDALARLVELHATPLLDSERAELALFLDTPVGRALLHEGYADATAAQALARRMDPSGFESLVGLAIAHRSSATRSLRKLSTLSRDDAHHTQYALRALLGWGYSAARLDTGAARSRRALDAAATGAIVFLWVHPEAASQAGLSSSLASKIATAGAESCKEPVILGALQLDCSRI